MAVINLGPPIATDLRDVQQLQDRFDGPLRALCSTPWGDGVLVRGLRIQPNDGEQELVIRHWLGRPVTGAVIWRSNIALVGPWGLRALDEQSAVVNVQPMTPVGGTVDIWIG